MGTYIVQSDIENVFGTANVARWSQLAPTSETADTARITSAIAYAEGVVEARFYGGRYLVPLSGSTGSMTMVKDWCAKIAGAWLYESRGINDTTTNAEGESVPSNRISPVRDAAMRQIDSVVGGVMKLGLTRSGTGPTAPVVVR